MAPSKISYLLCLLMYNYITQKSICQVQSIRYTRVLEKDNRVVQNGTRMSKNNIGECSKSCFEATFCASFIFNINSLACVLLTESFVTLVQENGWIHFSALQNLAFNKSSKLSRTLHKTSANMAVDGIVSTDFHDYSCASTKDYSPEDRPYWYVDLDDMYDIYHVEFINRGDCCPERLHDVEVTVAESNKNFTKTCGFFKGPGSASQTVVLQCPKGTRGRYVKLQIIEGINNILTLCEVKVIGKQFVDK